MCSLTTGLIDYQLVAVPAFSEYNVKAFLNCNGTK